jgi:flavin-dependent dehydrogenase
MHVFRNGYCGLVKIEEDLYNLCYLTTAANLQEYDGDISKMEEQLLSRNPRIAKIFGESIKCNEAPLAISQVSFDRKSQVAQRILMIGDAAGMITPLCGNGISMALHSSKIAAEIIHSFLENKITREDMEEQYSRNWQKRFGPRLATGRKLQRLVMKKGMSDLFIHGGRILPGLMKWLIRQTHGQPF